MFNYYLKIVPTVYMRGSNYGEPIYTNQFSVTRYRKDLSDRERGMPGIFFSYELSPLMVKYAEKHKSVEQMVSAISIFILFVLYPQLLWSLRHELLFHHWRRLHGGRHSGRVAEQLLGGHSAQIGSGQAQLTTI